jgi:hypothetical protein
MFMGGVVVHHQMQLDLGVGPRHVLQEREELLVPVLLAQPDDLAGVVSGAANSVVVPRRT